MHHLILVVLLLVGCTKRESVSPVEAFGSSDSEGYVLIEGSCSKGLPPETVPELHAIMVAKSNDLGFVRIRSNAAFSTTDLSNLLGTVPCGTRFVGLYGIKNREFGNALGCYVRIRDRSGHRAIGYVAADVVDFMPEVQFPTQSH